MTSNRCPICIGSGEIMGGGMMPRDCPACDGSGKVNSDVRIKEKVVVDRRSKTYKEAIAKIMEGGLDKEAAARIFDEEFEKL